jgi:hypothetical protein
MKIETNETVSYDVKNVVIRSMHLSCGGGKLRIESPYEWQDAGGKVIRRGSHVATEESLVALGDAVISAIPIIKGLVRVGRGGSSVVFFGTDGTITRIFQNGRETPESDNYVQNNLTGDQIATAIAPLTVEQLVGMVQAMTRGVLTN